MRFSAVYMYSCTTVENSAAAEGGETVKCISVRCRKGGLHPQERAREEGWFGWKMITQAS